VEVERLYETPFTNLHQDGLDGVFDDDQADEIITLIGQLDRPPPAP
jgi:type I restriction enzyme, R subunit